MSQHDKHRLVDCGDQKKLEFFGPYLLIRPCPQALWPKVNPDLWRHADAEFERTGEEKGVWKNLTGSKILAQGKKRGEDLVFPENWTVESPDGLRWQVEPNQFGNIGIFTEHWVYGPDLGEDFFKKNGKILNLFTYSGSSCVALAKNGFKITAVDSSKAAMDTYTKNLELNQVEKEGQRLILEDCYKFMAREVRRESQYDGIMIDAPSYGRGTKGEVFKIEDDILRILETAKNLLTENGKLVLTLHSPRFTPAILRILTGRIFVGRKVEAEEILQVCESGIELPSGFLVKVY